MAVQKQKQYEDALGSIFDFMFEQSQKSSRKLKPVKVTGVDGTSELVDAMGDVLAAPGLFVNGATLDAFEDSLNLDLVKLNFGDRGGGISFKSKDLALILKNPGKYIDAQFTKMEAIRKSERAAAAGEMMRSVVAGAWAHKRGLDSVTRMAMMGMGRPDAFTHDLMTRTNKLLEKHFVGGGKQFTKNELVSRYGAVKGGAMFEMYSKAETAYKSGDSKAIARIYSGAVDEKGESVDVSKLYSLLESAEIRDRAQRETDPLRKANYGSAADFVDNMAVLQDIKNFQRETKKTVQLHRDSIEQLKSQGAPQSQIDYHRQRLKELDSDLRMVRRYELAGKLGEYQGFYASAKDLFVDGNLLPNIINGRFFDGRFNQISWLQPAKLQTKTIKIGGKDATISFLRAKDTDNKFLNAYNEAMMPLYYLSPANLVKSLATGEVFGYRAHVIQKVFEKKMRAVLSQNIANFDMKNFMQQILDGNGQQYLSTLQGQVSSDLMKKMTKFVGSQERLNKLSYYFGSIDRAKKWVQDFINEKVGAKVRDAVGKQLLKVAFIKTFASEAVNAWILKGGIYGLVKGVVSAGVQAIGQLIGVTAPGIGNAIAFVVTTIIMYVGGKILQPVLKLALESAIVFTLGFVAVFFLIFGSFHLLVFGKHSHVAPNQIVQCTAYSPIGLLPVDEPGYPGIPGGPGGTGGSIPPFVPGNLPPGQQCLFSSGPSLRCTQGPFSYCPSDPGYVRHWRPSHLNSPAIDVATGGNFNAPTFCDSSLGNCKVVTTGQGTCNSNGVAYPAGEYVIFKATHEGRTYQFYILHVASGVTSGQTLGPGQAVATIVDSPDWRMCSSGLHAHLTVQVNGSYVDAREAMNQDFKCNIGDCLREQCWPRR